MNPQSEHIEPQFRSGADGLIDVLTRLTDTVVIVSDGIRDGYRLQSNGSSRKIHFSEKTGETMSYAIGLAMTGRDTSVVLDTEAFHGVRSQIHSALLRHVPLTVIVARSGNAPFEPVEEFGDIGCPMLCASGAQSLMDLSVVAHAVAKAAMMPVLVVAHARHSLWTYQRLSDSPSIGDLTPGPALRFYRSEIEGREDASGRAWIDPSQPMGSGIVAPGEVQLKRTIGRRVFVENELPDLIDRAMQAFSAASGRTYAAVESVSRRPDDVALIFAGANDDALRRIIARKRREKPGLSLVGITRIRPFPVEELRSCVSRAHGVGVLNVANGVRGKDSRLTTDVRAALYGTGASEHRRIWDLHANDEAARRPIVPVLHAPDWIPGAGDVEAIAQRLARPGLDAGPLVVGVRLSGEELRLPAVEELVQRMKRSGISFSGFEVRSGEDVAAASGIYVIGESIQTAWPLVEKICGLLDAAGARDISGSLHTESMPASSPVIASVSFEADVDAPSFAICPSPRLLYTLPARAVVPNRAVVLTLSPDGGPWPFWMAEKHWSLRVIPVDDASPEANELMLGALAKSHPLLDRAPGEALKRAGVLQSVDWPTLSEQLSRIHEAGPDEFETPDREPPEFAPLAELKDRAPTSRPVADLLTFWRSLGHLYRSAGLSEAPVDALLTSHYLPASTGPLLGRGRAGEHIPSVISERCTGCGACWTVCPEAAVVVRPFSIEALWDATMTSTSGTFVQLPRLAQALIKTAHRLVKEDELHQYLTIGELFSEAFERVLDKTGLEGEKRTAVEAERDAFLSNIAGIHPIRSEPWFDRREEVASGSGALLGIGIDPDACTSCGLCLAACRDEAMETVDSVGSQKEWGQISGLPTLPGEDKPSEYFDHPAAVLTGKTSRRVFRAGGSDTANLSRTTLRLFLEAGQERATMIGVKMLEEVDSTIVRIDARLQQTIDESVRINDFERFSRELRDAGKNLASNLEGLFEDRSAGATDRLVLLADCRTRLMEEKSRLASQVSANLHPHMVAVDATTGRQLRLASYPVNPFSIPYYRVQAEDAANLVSGITRGFIDRYSELGRQLRIARQILDDVLDAETKDDVLPEDVQWAESVLPHIALITDRIDFSTLEALKIGAHMRILSLSDAGTAARSKEGIDADVLAHLLDHVYIAKLTIADPVRLLAAFSKGVSGSRAVLFQVYAPDPVRDGISPDDALKVAERAEQSGAFVSPQKEPEKVLSVDESGDETPGAAIQGERPQPANVTPDALSVLTRKLLELSGYAGSGESLTSWLAGREEVDAE